MCNKYLLDSNIFITAFRQHYPIDLMPAFWEKMKTDIAPKSIIISAVYKELKDGQDALFDWICQNENFFTVLGDPPLEVIESFKIIINYVEKNKQYNRAAKDVFAKVADPWLCAYGMTFDYCIVTYEIYEPRSKKKIQIPNICKEFNIKYLDMIDFLREIKFKI
ncbi:MAG: DUF4411 family protein [Clostridiaceae bacterium]|nr:DUF4411 family protein [Clostridiaceae bacterium]